MSKTSLPTYQIILDTNVLWHNDKTIVVNPDFDQFYQENLNSNRFKILLPKIVCEEILFQHTNSALKTFTNLKDTFKELSQKTNKNYPCKLHEDKIKEDIRKKFEKWVKKVSATIIEVPITNINWNDIIHNSLWRLAPFTFDNKNDKNEKGFRDAMIAETVYEIVNLNIQNNQIVFISDDNLLRDTIKEKLFDNNLVSTYNSIDDFNSQLKLKEERITKQRGEILLKRAPVKFKIILNNVIRKIHLEYKADFNKTEEPKSDYSSQNPWEPINKESIYILGTTQFEKRDEPFYYFVNKLRFLQLFSSSSNLVHSQEPTLDQFSSMLAKYYPKRFTEDDEYLDAVIKMRSIDFSILWKAKISKRGSFLNIESDLIKRISFNFQRVTKQTYEKLIS